MKILSVLWHPEYTVRLCESVLDALLLRGHQIHLGFTATSADELERAAGPWLRKRQRRGGLTWGLLPVRNDRWAGTVKRLRDLRNYLGYLDPLFDDRPLLRQRFFDPLGRWARAGLRCVPGLRRGVVRRCLDGAARRLLPRLPTDPAIDSVLREYGPDLLVISPLVHYPACQHDYLQSGLRQGIPTAVLVASWDNLTTKDRVHEVPDRVIVWNETQKQEAAALHGLPADRVVVTGAHAYDQWFVRPVSRPRREFLGSVGLDPASPYVLYLCSSRFLQQDERAFIRRWLAALRSSDSPRLRSAGVMIRPYPTSAAWEAGDLLAHGNVTVWPRCGEQNLLDGPKDRYFHSLVHSSAVVGVNTSGLLEAGILGKRCFTIGDPEFRHKQAGTVHFGYLTSGGFLASADSLEEHLGQLDEELRQPGRHQLQVRAFLRAFLRPGGLGRAGTPAAVEALESLVPAARAGRAARAA